MRDNKFVSGAALSETAFGGFNGVTEISATANRFRTGFYGALSTDTAQYGLRADAAYGSGVLPGGWSLAANVAAIGWNRMGYDPYAVYVGVGKAFSSSHQLSAAFMRDQEPVAFLRYDYTPSPKFQAYTTVLGRFGAGGSLHAAGGFTWKTGRLFRLSGGVDGRKGIREARSDNRAEGWIGGLLTLGKVGLHAGLRGGYYTSQLGKSALYSAKAGLTWALAHSWQLSANTGLFRYNGSIPSIFSSDVNLAFNTNGINLKLTGFYERSVGTKDIHTGLDLGFRTPVFVIPNLSLQGQVTAGHFGAAERFGCHFLYGGLSWNSHAWFADAGFVYDKPYRMLDASAGKTWVFQRNHLLGVALGLRPYFGESAPSTRFSFRVFCRI